MNQATSLKLWKALAFSLFLLFIPGLIHESVHVLQFHGQHPNEICVAGYSTLTSQPAFGWVKYDSSEMMQSYKSQATTYEFWAYFWEFFIILLATILFAWHF